ncbi:hypothetical protein LX64_02730 [Chitinophaga skermanii]|uniref:Uncharacterized protein n=1 Tax=Chitinophaga skermanii TaxID=331697 RepID=A0A327QKH5_9BACT|nr:hypothetical protein [Chitinophaga skermanii]RAJ03853.1 hypothetical protein LX64_02730 [Chitinophaga skermanii]
MQHDYLMRMVTELGQAIRAVIMRKRDNPRKALEEIQVAYSGTPFKNMNSFSLLSAEDTLLHLQQSRFDVDTLDALLDLLLLEIEIKEELGLQVDIQRMLANANVLFNFILQKEATAHTTSLNRAQQKEKLARLIQSNA